MASYTFCVEMDPRPKKRPKVYRWATVNPSEEDEKLLADKIREMPNCPKEPLEGQIRVQFKFYKKPPKNTPQWKIPYMERGYIRPTTSPDLDNYVKLILDALNGILWIDDRYIVEMHTAKFFSPTRPRIEIYVDTLEIPKYKNQGHLLVSERNEVEDLTTFFKIEEKDKIT